MNEELAETAAGLWDRHFVTIATRRNFKAGNKVYAELCFIVCCACGLIHLTTDGYNNAVKIGPQHQNDIREQQANDNWNK